MPMSKEYLKKLLRASWEIEAQANIEEPDQEECIRPFEAGKKATPTVKENSLYPSCE